MFASNLQCVSMLNSPALHFVVSVVRFKCVMASSSSSLVLVTSGKRNRWNLMHKYKTWCTNTKLDAQIQNLMHKYKTWCTNTNIDAQIQNLMHTYKTWCTHTKLDAQMPILIHKCQYWCTDTNIDAQMPISMHKCQYWCTNANSDARILNAYPYLISQVWSMPISWDWVCNTYSLNIWTRNVNVWWCIRLSEISFLFYI